MIVRWGTDGKGLYFKFGDITAYLQTNGNNPVKRGGNDDAEEKGDY